MFCWWRNNLVDERKAMDFRCALLLALVCNYGAVCHVLRQDASISRKTRQTRISGHFRYERPPLLQRERGLFSPSLISDGLHSIVGGALLVQDVLQSHHDRIKDRIRDRIKDRITRPVQVEVHASIGHNQMGGRLPPTLPEDQDRIWDKNADQVDDGPVVMYIDHFPVINLNKNEIRR